MENERKFYLAVVRPENLERLVAAGLAYFAVHALTMRIKPGDRLVLYRSKGGTSRPPGVIGAFEVTEPARGRTRADNDTFSALYPTRIPWRTISVSLSEPLDIAPLVPRLRLFTNKERYGGVLQRSMLRLTREDYEILETALIEHAEKSPK